jgi:hypothetical protein
MLKIPNNRCYVCNAPATGSEHVPAKCFFPKDQRHNLITVPSCYLHNNAKSLDDEYLRGIIVSAKGNNKLALNHWRNNVIKSFIHSPKLFLKTFANQRDNAFFHDRSRIDAAMSKIAYALYFYVFNKVWHSIPTPYYKNFRFDDGRADIDVRLPNHDSLPKHHVYEGSNQSIFKYQYFEGKINGQPNCMFRLIFYEGFEVIILPANDDG